MAVDIPFGWPAEFARFVSEWRPVADAPAPPEPDRFRFRVTDRIVRKEARKLPLPVSADRIAMGARAWAELLSTHGLARRVDVRGTLCPDAPTVIEVYPGASARAFLMSPEAEPPEAEPSYKSNPDVRRRLVESIATTFYIDLNGYLERIVSRPERSDETDAFLAAITAAVYFADCTGSVLADSPWRIRRPKRIPTSWKRRPPRARSSFPSHLQQCRQALSVHPSVAARSEERPGPGPGSDLARGRVDNTRE